MPIKKLGLLGNPEKPEIKNALDQILDFAETANVAVHLSRRLATLVDRPADVLPKKDLVRNVDTVIALGGDGTMLRAARQIGSTGTPLLGINLGSLGYLTDVPLEDLRQCLEQLVSGDYHIDERSRVDATIWRDGVRKMSFSALNDVVVNMGPQARALDMEVKMEGVSLGRFLGDGLIISTPTGSTAYNLSAGGPICHSGVQCLIITPICPHSLAIRPLVVPCGEGIELILHYSRQAAVVTADGQKFDVLKAEDRLAFDLHANPIRLIKFPQSNFYSVMRRKLNWGAPKRRQNGDDDAR